MMPTVLPARYSAELAVVEFRCARSERTPVKGSAGNAACVTGPGLSIGLGAFPAARQPGGEARLETLFMGRLGLIDSRNRV